MATYSIATTALLVGTTAARVRRWCRDAEAPCGGDAVHLGGATTLGFRGLLEAAVASALAAQRLTASDLRIVVRAARDVFEDANPLATARFLAEGEDLAEAVLGGRRHIRPFGFGAIDHDRNGSPLRWWPRGREKGVVVDPDMCSGRAVEVASFVPVRALAASVDAEGSVERAAAVWEVEVASVRRALDFRDLVGRI